MLHFQQTKYVQMEKRSPQKDLFNLFAEKGDFLNKKRPKRDPKNGVGLLRDRVSLIDQS